MSEFRKIDINDNRLGTDAWHRNKAVTDYSLFRGRNTLEISRHKWKKLLNGTEVINGSIDANVKSVNGETIVEALVNNRYTLRSLKHPGYQPNRGHLFSDSCWIPNASGGTFGLTVRTTTVLICMR